MNRRLQIFISSKMQELAPEREAVKSALSDLLIDAWVFEKDAGARPTSIQGTYLKELDEADLYIGIFWKGYGEYTIEEYDYARAKGKDCLIYEKREAIEGARDPALQEFLDKLSKVESGLTIRWFHRPDELAGFIKKDVAEWQTEIVRRARRPQLTAPFQAPPKSDRYVDRVQLHTSLKAAVLRSAETSNRPPLTRAVLHGIGGAGKTSVASAFAHDPDVRRAYPDGVLWAFLGQTPNLLQLQSRWGRALEDPKAANLGYPDSPTAENQLRTLLQDRACLLVVDDAWKGDDVEDAFLVGGPRCLLLVTTRQAEVAKKLDAEVFELSGMAEAEALALFERWSGPLPEKDSATARWLAKQVDYLPLALELIGAQIGRVDGWSDYRSRWEAQRLASLKRGRRASGSKDNVLDSLELSVKALPEDDRIAYLQTAVFPQGATFPASAAAALWNMSEFEASELLIDLADQALVSRREHGGKTWFGFHALLQEYVVEANGAEGITQANRSLISGYRKQCPNGWATAKDDGYLFNNLSYHLAAAGETAELYSLVDKPWMQAQFARSESHRPFAQDVERALEKADSERPRNWTMMVRCRYVVTGLQAQAADMAVELLEVLARTGRTRRAMEAAALFPDAWARSKAFRKLAQVMIESGSYDEATSAVRRAVEAVDEANYPYKQYVAETHAIAAEQMFRCGNQSEAKELLVRANAELQSVPELENRCFGWDTFARAQVVIDGPADAISSCESWLEEIEASSGNTRLFAAAMLAEDVLSVVEITDSEFFDRLLKIALYLHQQGRGDWALAETIGALARSGAVARACELLPKISDASNCIRAATPCAQAAHKIGDQALTERSLSKLYESVERCAKEGRGIDSKLFTPLRKIVVEAQGQAGLVQLTQALSPLSDPVWRSFGSSQLAVAAAALGDANAAAQHAGEAARVLSEALQSSQQLHGEAVRTETAIALVEAGHLDTAISIVNGVSDRSYTHLALCRVALKLIERGDAQQAETLVERALSETAAPTSADIKELSAACVAAETLSRIGAAEHARAILEAAKDKVPLIAYDSVKGAAFVRLTEALKVIGETSKARDELRTAFPLFDASSWEDSASAQSFELACTLYDDAELDGVLATLSDNWWRRSWALPGVVKGLIARGQTERAQNFYNEVRQNEGDYDPIFEVGKAESLVELAKLDDEKVLEWLKDGAGLFEPGLRAGMLGHEAAAWIRLNQLGRADTALQHALDSCNEMSNEDARHQKLSQIGQELAAAGAPDLAQRSVEKIAAGTPQDDALRAIALALIKTPRSADAIRVIATVQDSVRRDQIFIEVAEQLADAGEYDSAVKCAQQSSLSEQWTPFIAATVAHHLAIAERRDEARAMLQHVDSISITSDSLVLARKAQTQVLLGDTAAAAESVTAALDLAWSTTGPFVFAWCAETLAQLGDLDQAATIAERALESVQDSLDEWNQAMYLEVAASALVAAKTLDGERLLQLVRGFENEYVRADALGKLYPHFRSAIPEVVKEFYAVIGDIKDAWAQAQAIGVLAERMGQSGDRAELHALLPIAEAIDNKWASAHAVGRLASGLAVGGDPDDLTQALNLMTGFKLPGWRRAAALAMAAVALRRVGESGRSSDLAAEALNVAVFQEDGDLRQRARYALRCANAALSLGDQAEAQRQAEIAKTCIARISRLGIFKEEYIDSLFNLASELGSPELLDWTVKLCNESEERSLFLRTSSDAAARLARMDQCSTALERIDRILGCVDNFDTDTAGIVYANAASVAHKCGELERAANYFSAALRVAGSRALFATALEANIDFLASIDQGATLARVFASLSEIDAWWQRN